MLPHPDPTPIRYTRHTTVRACKAGTVTVPGASAYVRSRVCALFCTPAHAHTQTRATPTHTHDRMKRPLPIPQAISSDATDSTVRANDDLAAIADLGRMHRMIATDLK